MKHLPFSFQICALLLSVGCRERSETPPAAPPPAQLSESVRFDDAFRLVDSVLLESSASAPLVRVSGFAVDESGRFVIADGSERSVRIHAPDGRLVARLGRSGDGPGEFRDPRYVIPRSNRELIVGEGTGRIHRFRNDSLVDTNQLDSLSFISSLVGGESGPVFASVGDPREARLVSYTTTGEFIARSTLRSGIPAPNSPDDPRWQSVYQLWSATCGGRTWVAATISDSVWVTGSGGRTWQGERVRFEGYKAPELPGKGAESNRMRPFDFIKQYHVIQGLICDGHRVGFTYVQGVRNYGDPQVFMLNTGDGWIAYSDALPVIRLRGDTALTLLQPQSENVWIGKHVLR